MLNLEFELYVEIRSGYTDTEKLVLWAPLDKSQKNLNCDFYQTCSTSEINGRNPKHSTTILSAPVLSISDPAILKLFLVLQNVVQAADMGQDLDNKLIATVQGKLGVAPPANASGRAGDTTGFQVRLRQRYTVFFKA